MNQNCWPVMHASLISIRHRTPALLRSHANTCSILLWIAVTACSRDVVPHSGVGTVSLQEVTSSVLDTVGPENIRSFALASDARIAFVGGFDMDDHIVTVVDARGNVERFGKVGQGPVEFGPRRAAGPRGRSPDRSEGSIEENGSGA